PRPGVRAVDVKTGFAALADPEMADPPGGGRRGRPRTRGRPGRRGSLDRRRPHNHRSDAATCPTPTLPPRRAVALPPVWHAGGRGAIGRLTVAAYVAPPHPPPPHTAHCASLGPAPSPAPRHQPLSARAALPAAPGGDVGAPAVVVRQDALGRPDRGVMDRSRSRRPTPRAKTRTPAPPAARK